MVTRRRTQKLVVALAAAIAVAVCAALYLRHRVELFVLPPLFREALRLEQELRATEKDAERRRELHAKLSRAAGDLIRLQRPEFEGGSEFGVEFVKTHEGGRAFVIAYRGLEGPVSTEPEGLDAGLHFIAADAGGRLFGADFQVPPWPNPAPTRQGYSKIEGAGGGPDILAVAGDAGYFLSVDSRGIVPRGAVPQLGLPCCADLSAPRVSSRMSVEVRRWLASLREPPATPDRLAELIGTPRAGDLFRALHEIELLGPSASRLARPLLAHPDPDIRSRAAAVAGNDASLWEDLQPLASDPEPTVRATARLALLGAPDLAVARKAFLDLLEERNDYVECGDFDHRRLLSTEVAGALLDWLEATGFPPERFWEDMRLEDLRPLVPRLEALWIRGRKKDLEPDQGEGQEKESAWKAREARKSLAGWLVRLDEPGLDRLLAAAILEECPEKGLGIDDATEEILAALLERATPLRGAGAADAVRRSAETAVSASRGMLAHLVLLRWGIPGAAESLLAKLREPRNDGWLLEDLAERLPRAILPALEALAAEQPSRYRERVAELAGKLK